MTAPSGRPAFAADLERAQTNYMLVRVTNGRLDAPRLVTSRQVQREDIA